MSLESPKRSSSGSPVQIVYTYVYKIWTGLPALLCRMLSYDTRAAPYSATVHRGRESDRLVCAYTFAAKQIMLHTLGPVGPNCQGVRCHFLAREGIAGGSLLSGGGIIFSHNKEARPCVRRCSWLVPAIRGGIKVFSA